MVSTLIEYIKNPYKILIYLDNKRIITLKDSTFIKLLYKNEFKKNLNLDKPETFNEKLQWLKLYNRNPEFTKMVDKYEAKKFVSDIIGEEHTIPTLGIYNSFEEINFDKLPNQFVIKCTHDSGGLIIVKNKEQLNIKNAKKRIKKCLKRNFYFPGREWPYKNVKPRIIIEKYMKNQDDEELVDYKFFCFNGAPKICLVCTERQKKLKETFFDENFKLMDLKRPNHNVNYSLKKPKNFEQMKKMAAKLSKGITFLRVDFYEVNEKVYFGELTFYPASGFSKFEPENYDQILGEMIELPKEKSLKNEK